MGIVTLFEKRREDLAAGGGPDPDLLVFDIDSTLMDTGPRNRAILDAAFGELPGLGLWRDRVRHAASSWNVLDPLAEAGLRDRALLERVRDFWRERFFTDEWVRFDTPYPGAASSLHDLRSRGFRLVYLTGRHSPGMEEGTRASFQDHGFPLDGGTSFLFKPSFEMEDVLFKEEACAAIGAMGVVAGTMDNEPGNVNRFVRAFPRALNLWLRTLTSPDPEPLSSAAMAVDADVFAVHQDAIQQGVEKPTRSRFP